MATEADRKRNREQSRRWAQANPEKVAEMNKRWRADNAERLREYNRKWQATKGLDNRLRRKYGISLERYNAMLADQDGKCALCLGDPGEKRLHVDHSHACCPGDSSCGKCVRALLCFTCNAGLGLFNDDPALLMRAAKFLDREAD